MDEEIDNDSTLLFKNIDAKVDRYAINLEKQIQKLPSTLKFIKKYLYYEFLPRIDMAINELEAIKETPNYDEKITTIRPISLRNTDNLTCIDMLNNHNIKHPKITKMVYGTLAGNICVYDIESDKIVTEKNISKTNRVDCLSTATTKYYDTYLTRIAVYCRSEINIYVLSYNHSFSIMNVECIISTVNPGMAEPIPNSKVSLGLLINTLYFSKDSFYLSAIDYQGGVRIYKFNDIPLMNPLNTIESVSSSGPSEGKGKEKADQKQAPSKENPINLFISHVKNKDYEDFTILPDTSKEEGNIPAKGAKKPDPKQQAVKPKGKDPKGNQKVDVNEPVVIDETVYNIQSESDPTVGDVSLLQKFDKNHPMCHFIQKKFIFEEKFNAGYSASTITIGIYIAFSNSNNFKYISLYPYLTDNMKTIFKVSKVKAGGALTVEESMSINSQMLKKEREYLNFVRSRLENTLNPISSLAVSSNTKEKEAPKGKDVKKDDKDKAKDKEKDKDPSSASGGQSNKSILEITKNEINFTTLFSITALVGQKSLSSVNNLLAIGMIDGSILVWDCELHCDKFLLQKNSRFEITSMCINDNYLTCGTKVGQIYMYELLYGKEVYSCYHNPYTADPIYFNYSFFPLMVLSLDIQNKLCLYNTKEKHKIAKLQLQEFDNQSTFYRISYFNQVLISQNEDYLAFICEKTDKQPKKTSLIDLIEFQKERSKLLLHKPHDPTTNFFNYYQEACDCEENKLKIQPRVMHMFKIRDILFKCYPSLVYTSKKGLSLKKIMKKYDSGSYPTFDKGTDLQKEADDFVNSKLKSPSKYSPKKSLKKEENERAMTVKMELLANLSQPNDTQKTNQEEKSTKINYISTQKKDIFYNSFKSIRDRYQYKDQRINNIQIKNEKISKELAAANKRK